MRDQGRIDLERLPIVVQRDVSVESGQLQATIRGDGHDLGRVEDEAHIVERRADEAPRRDVALVVLGLESRLEREAREEGPHGGDEELELGGRRGEAVVREVPDDGELRVLQGDVVVDHGLDVAHDLGVAPRGFLGHVGQGEGRVAAGAVIVEGAALGVEDVVRLGVEDEGHGQEAFDPFFGELLAWCCNGVYMSPYTLYASQ